MNKPQTFPDYLPAFDRRLEYQAGLFIPMAPTAQRARYAKKLAAQPDGQQWLGEDFSHVIVNR